MAREHPRLLRHRRAVPARGGDQRLRVLEPPLRPEGPGTSGDLHRQPADRRPLRPRARGRARARGRVPAHPGHREGQAPRLLPLPRHHVLLPAGARSRGPRSCRPSSGPWSSRPDPRTAGTCSSTRPRRATEPCSSTSGAPASSAASTACGAGSRRRSATESSASCPFRTTGSSTTCAPRAAWSPTAASPCSARRSTCAARCSPYRCGKQFEQVVNARYLELEGYGVTADEVTGPVLGDFLASAPDLRRKLAGYHQDGNESMFACLEERLAAAVGGGRARKERPTGRGAPKGLGCHLATRFHPGTLSVGSSGTVGGGDGRGGDGDESGLGRAGPGRFDHPAARSTPQRAGEVASGRRRGAADARTRRSARHRGAARDGGAHHRRPSAAERGWKGRVDAVTSRRAAPP